jgi:MoxR-like ATPase
MATQNPLEQEGTYPLPEAQLDRFLMHVRVGYPDAADEKAILALTRAEARSQAQRPPPAEAVIGQQHLLQARNDVLDIHLDASLEDYIVEIILATRSAERYGEELAGWIQHGASPRATMALDRCARAYAWLNNRDYVVPEDIQLLAPDVLRHRIILSFAAEAEGRTADSCIAEILSRVAVP